MVITVTFAELRDLAVNPGETLQQIVALGFERVDDLLYARHVSLPSRACRQSWSCDARSCSAQSRRALARS